MADDETFSGSADTEHHAARSMGSGRIGWNWGTSDWEDGEFFRFDVVDARHR